MILSRGPAGIGKALDASIFRGQQQKGLRGRGSQAWVRPNPGTQIEGQSGKLRGSPRPEVRGWLCNPSYWDGRIRRLLEGEATGTLVAAALS